MSASSAPAFTAWMRAITSCSLEWQLRRWSSVSGGGLRTVVVNRVMPASATAGSAALCSAIITMLGPPTTLEGCWDGVFLSPRVTMSLACTSSCMSLCLTVAYRASATSSRLMPMSRSMAAAPANNRSRCLSRKANRPWWRRSPSHMPSPTRKPLSNTDTLASCRAKNSPLMKISTDSLRSSASAWWVLRDMAASVPTAVAKGCGRVRRWSHDGEVGPLPLATAHRR